MVTNDTSKIKSQFNNNSIESVFDEPIIFGVSDAKVLDKDGKVVFEGNVCIANFNGVRIMKRDDQ